MKTIIIALLLVALVSVGNNKAETYVSFNGGFYIQYPDDWTQVSYLTADVFLSRSSKDKSILNYEAVFAPKTSSPFFANDYLILTIETMDWLYEYREDSIVEEMKQGFGEGIEYFPSWDKPGDVKTNQPVYDQEHRILSVVNDIVEGDKVVKKNMLVRRFYDKGVANFYFYSLDSVFEQSQTKFREIVKSFGTENVQQQLPQEKVKVASDVGSDRTIDIKTMLIAIGLAVVIVGAILFHMRAAAKRKEKTV